jgi:hypothetical protein
MKVTSFRLASARRASKHSATSPEVTFGLQEKALRFIALNVGHIWSRIIADGYDLGEQVIGVELAAEMRAFLFSRALRAVLGCI